MESEKTSDTYPNSSNLNPENFIQIIDSETDENPPAAKSQKTERSLNNTDDLFKEIITQNTYTDIVDIILKYLKSTKGSPEDLVKLLGFIKTQIVVLIEEEAVKNATSSEIDVT